MGGVAGWLSEREVTRVGTVTPRQAVFVVSLAYLLGFGRATINAVGELIQPGWRLYFGPFPLDEVPALAALGLAIWALNREASGWWRPDPAAGARRWFGAHAFAWLTLATFTTFVVGGPAMRPFPRPSEPTMQYNIESFVSSVLAGPTEEVILVALPVVLLRGAGLRWRTVILVALAMRLSFHVYYGWGSLALLIWAAAAIVIYIHTRSVIVMCITHSWYDLTVDIGLMAGLPDLTAALRALMIVTAGIIAAAGVTAWIAGLRLTSGGRTH